MPYIKKSKKRIHSQGGRRVRVRVHADHGVPHAMLGHVRPLRPPVLLPPGQREKVPVHAKEVSFYRYIIFIFLRVRFSGRDSGL